jgi:hypothetical protein
MLTTLTTVLGLSPLLYETSSQAQFLKPTVITLVYGLGFGMVLVLIVVPALMAMQADIAAQVSSFKRALRGLSKARGPVLPVATALVLVSVLFVGTLGWVLITGGLPLPLSNLALASMVSAPQLALVLFLVSSAVVVMLVYFLSALSPNFLARR